MFSLVSLQLSRSQVRITESTICRINVPLIEMSSFMFSNAFLKICSEFILKRTWNSTYPYRTLSAVGTSVDFWWSTRITAFWDRYKSSVIFLIMYFSVLWLAVFTVVNFFKINYILEYAAVSSHCHLDNVLGMYQS